MLMHMVCLFEVGEKSFPVALRPAMYKACALENGGQLPAHTDLPAREVAQAVGYTAAGHSAQLFRRVKGYAAGRISKNSP